MTKKKSRVKNEILLWTLTAVVLIIVWYFFKDKNASHFEKRARCVLLFFANFLL